MTAGITTYVCATHTYVCACIPKYAPTTAEKKEMSQRELPHHLYLSEAVASVLLQMKSFGYGDRKLPIGLSRYTSPRASCQHSHVLE